MVKGFSNGTNPNSNGMPKTSFSNKNNPNGRKMKNTSSKVNAKNVKPDNVNLKTNPTANKGQKKTVKTSKKDRFFSRRKIRNFFSNIVNWITGFENVPAGYRGGILIWLPAFILLCVGTISVISATSVLSVGAGSNVISIFYKPIIFFVAGLLIYLFARFIPISTYRLFVTAAMVVIVIVQFVTVLTGTAIYGNTNWITIAGFTLQPSEFMKFVLILHLADIFSSPKFQPKDLTIFLSGDWERIIPLATELLKRYILVGLACVSVLIGRDMGTFMIIAAFIFIMLVANGTSFKLLFSLIGVGVVGFAFAVLTNASRRARVFSFIFGDDTSSVRDLQNVQSIWGLASGGLTGLGAGASREKWGYLPAARTDFIYSIIGEEFGLAGTLFVIFLFIFLAYGLFTLMFVHNDPFVKLAACGIVSWIIVQAIVNILVVIGFAPILGVPLPLISSGGSALLSVMAAIGFTVRAASEQAGLAKGDRKFAKRGKAIAVYQSKTTGSSRINTEFKRPNRPRG